MGERQPVSDLVVVIPGIAGSVLAVEGTDIWALSGSALSRNLFSLGRSFGRLELPRDIGQEEPNDGVVATRVMPDLHVIPGLWSPIKGYQHLVRELRTWVAGSEDGWDYVGNPFVFPYDWRLSNVVAARRLEAVVVPALERWRERTRNPQAKLILFCHSMGGLVARWFLEVLEGWELTRWLITVGTPYQGAVKALEVLVNGVPKAFGPLRSKLTDVVRTFPSVYELLPIYPCLDLGNGRLRRLDECTVPNLRPDLVAGAGRFHAAVARAAATRPHTYKTLAIKGIVQPTGQSARLRGSEVEVLREHGGIDRGGDGTVARPSSHPPEWEDEDSGMTVMAAQRHSTLQETDAVMLQLFGRLTGRLGTWMGGEQIGAEVPHLVPAGEDLVVEATAAEDTLALIASVVACGGRRPAVAKRLLTNAGGGRYVASFPDLPPGAYEVTVSSAGPDRPVDPVSDLTIVWQSHAG